MNLKVIKAIKGLVEGDILYYNQEQDQYEITKVDEEVSDGKISKKTLKVIIGSWLVEDNKEFFKYVDDEDSDITVEEFKYEQKEEDKNIDSSIGDQLKVFKKEMEDFKQKITSLLPEMVPTQPPPPPISNNIFESLKKENEELKKSIEMLQNPFSTYVPYTQPIEVYYTKVSPSRYAW